MYMLYKLCALQATVAEAVLQSGIPFKPGKKEEPCMEPLVLAWGFLHLEDNDLICVPWITKGCDCSFPGLRC